MKRLLILIFVLAAAAWAYFQFFAKKEEKGPSTKEVKMLVKTHSDAFNNSVDNVVTHYLAMKDAFVTADTAKVKEENRLFMQGLDSIPVQELDADKAAVSATAKQSIADIKSNATSLQEQTDVTEMRRDFNMLTQMMYPAFFQSINYEGKKLYFDYCPMAFDGDQGANWLSADPNIINPYLGKNHPKYHATMLECGEVKDSIEAK